ncbi:MAG TPA: hypothetical protein QF611_09650, partial [Pseudomonadales bacterium]|nr:hypothetical protein [Pseudomonadales bacterium]
PVIISGEVTVPTASVDKLSSMKRQTIRIRISGTIVILLKFPSHPPTGASSAATMPDRDIQGSPGCRFSQLDIPYIAFYARQYFL